MTRNGVASGRSGLLPACLLVIGCGMGVSGQVQDGGTAPSEEGSATPSPPRAQGVEVEFYFPEQMARALPSRGAWLPVYAEFRATDGASHVVRLDGVVQGGSPRRTSFRTRSLHEVGPGAPLRTWLYLRVGKSEEGVHSVRVDVEADGKRLSRAEWIASTSNYVQRVGVIVVGDAFGDVTPWPGPLAVSTAGGGTRRNFGRNRFGPSTIDAAVEAVAVERLPDNLAGYDACEIVVLQEPEAAALEPAQMDALETWVRLGGLLVVVPVAASDAIFQHAVVQKLVGSRLGPVARSERMELGTLLPMDGLVDQWRDASEEELIAAPADTVVAHLDPVPVAEGAQLRRIETQPPPPEEAEGVPFPDGTEARPRLYMELPCGRGSVGILTFDTRSLLEVRERGEFARALWGTIVRWRLERGASALQMHWAAPTSAAVVRELRDESRDIGLSFLIALIGVYLVLVGPLLYFYLKRKGRLLALIWAEPVVAVLYVGVVFAVGYFTKGVLTKTERWTLFKQVEGTPLGSRESYLSIFAADEGEYGVEAQDADFLLTVAAQEAAGDAIPVLASDRRRGRFLEGFELELWQQGFVVSGKFLRFEEDGIALETENVDGLELVRVRNNLPYAIRSGLVFRDDDLPLVIPRLPAGAAVSLSVEAADGVYGEWTSDRIREVREKARLGYGVAGQRLRVMAALERDTEDLRLDRPHTTKSRTDVFLLLEKEGA